MRRMKTLSDHLPRTPVHTFGETLRPQPADYVVTAAAAKPTWRRTVVAALAAACLPALAYGAFLYFLLTRSPS